MRNAPISSRNKVSKIRRRIARAAIAGIAAVTTLAIGAPFAVAQNAQTWQTQGKRPRHIVVTLNKSLIFDIRQPFSSAIVGQPEYADVLPMTNNSIYI
ncbi:MAG: pilus assembly protein N-terminal domain-containing protein, partial [Hyphomicrobiales bacterium]|nr:pilus assembly protein N-terminal domain-containing protein [Hyphomicrobiales bacterium]